MSATGAVPAQMVDRRSPLTGWRGRGRLWLVPLSLGFLYAWPFPHFEFLHSPNELSRLYQVRAIVDDHTLAVNAQVERYGPMGDLSEARGRLFPNKAPGISLLGVPVYAALRAARGGADRVPNRALLYFLRLFCCALPTLLLLRPLRRYAARVSGDVRAADAAVLTYAFGTLALPYSLLFFSHQLSANLAVGAFLALERARQSPRAPGLQLFAGLLAGYAVVTEYTLAPVAAMLFVYGVATGRDRLPAAARVAVGALPCVLVLAWYHTSAFGSPLATGYQFVQNQTFAGWHAQGLMGVTWPRAASLAGNLFSAGRGLFAFSPALLVALWGLRAQLREAPADGVLALAVTAFYLFLAASFVYEGWGWMLGPRHLAPLAPFLVAPLACAIALLRRRAPRGPAWNLLGGVSAGLCAGSILVNGLCTAVFPHIPDEFSAALAHLVWPLATSGHLPYNLGEVWLGTVSPWSWAPWFAGLALVAHAAASRALEKPRWWPAVLAGAGALGLYLLLLFVAVPAESPQERASRSRLEQQWEPSPGNVKPGLF